MRRVPHLPSALRPILTNSDTDIRPGPAPQPNPDMPVDAMASVHFRHASLDHRGGDVSVPLAGGHICASVYRSCCGVSHRPIYNLHASLGLAVLALFGARIIARFIWPWPGLPDDMSFWQKLLAEAVHVALYALMIALPLVGWSVISAPGCCYARPFVFDSFVLPRLASTPFPRSRCRLCRSLCGSLGSR